MTSNGTNGLRKCHYEVLGVERNVDADELRRVYRQLALKLHPDKNRDVDPQTANEIFQGIQQAYEVLSDPQERAWYDAHREAILRHGNVGEADVEVRGIDLFPYFSSACYHGFDEAAEGGKDFYTVYRDLFENLFKEDLEYGDDVEPYPSFGSSSSEDEEWQDFYSFFSAYVTPRSYAWLDKYDTRQADNRRVARLMEKENKKVRDASRKERNDLVRALVKFVRKRDRRVAAFNKRLEEKALENAKKTEARRKQHLEERARLLEQTEAERGFGMQHMEDALQSIEDAYDSDGDNANFCVACNKQLRNDKAYASHLKQQKHLDNVRMLREAIEQADDVDLGALGPSLSQVLGKNEDSSAEEDKSESVKEENAATGDTNAVDDDPKESKSDSKPKARAKKPRKNKGSGGGKSTADSTIDADKTCAVCKNTFVSKNKLFAHLSETGHKIFLQK